METKNQDDFVLNVFNWMGYAHHFTIPPNWMSGGLALFWKEEVQVDILESSANHIDTNVTFKSSSSYVTFIYGAPQQENIMAFWGKKFTLGLGREDAWIISGDFNDILNNTEKIGSPPRWEGSFQIFTSFVSQNGLWDLKHSGNSLS